MARVKAKLRSFGRRLTDAINKNGYAQAHRILILHGFKYNPETKQYERKGN